MEKLTHHALGLEAISISKKFGSLIALDSLSLTVKAGTFHCLLGENGAGKSTFVKCLIGYHPPDQGSFLIQNKEEIISSPKEAQRLKIGMVYQHFTLAMGMSVEENLLLARAHLPSLIDWKKERQDLELFFDKMPFRLNLKTQVSALAAGEKQKLEILKQLYLGQKLLILDEPTSVLTPNEATEILGLLKRLTQDKKLTIILITHKLREVQDFGDEITILRKGKKVGQGLVKDLSSEKMAEMMIGKEVNFSKRISFSTQSLPLNQAPHLDMQNLTILNDRGVKAINSLSLALYPGQIIGIAGVSGNGQKELMDVLLGQRQLFKGTIKIGLESYSASRKQMRRYGLFSLPEEPLLNACVTHMTLAENMAFRNFDQKPLAQGWRLDRKMMISKAHDLIKDYDIRPSDPLARIESLSGGNIQRVVLARELSKDIKILLVANPTFGLDFSATKMIHDRLIEARLRGTAILLVSEDLDEILNLADIILVLSGGKITYQTQSEKADIAKIGRAMAGH
jgi:simple sugar transport system ATP-binding protein